MNYIKQLLALKTLEKHRLIGSFIAGIIIPVLVMCVFILALMVMKVI